LEVVDTHGDAVLLDHHPAAERVELGQHGTEVDRALTERTEQAHLPSLLDAELAGANPLEQTRIDVLRCRWEIRSRTLRASSTGAPPATAVCRASGQIFAIRGSVGAGS